MDKLFWFEGNDGDDEIESLNKWFADNGAMEGVIAKWRRAKHPYPAIAEMTGRDLEWDELHVWSGRGYGTACRMVLAFPCVVSLNEHGYPQVHTDDESLSQFEVMI